jgi:hypothetical protein
MEPITVIVRLTFTTELGRDELRGIVEDSIQYILDRGILALSEGTELDSWLVQVGEDEAR